MTVLELAFFELGMENWCSAYGFSMTNVCLDCVVSIRASHFGENWIDAP